MALSTPLVDAPPHPSAVEPHPSAVDGTAFVPVIVAEARCKGCGLCVDACPTGSLALDEHVVNAMGHHPARLVDAEACTSCAKCARVCPDAGLTILARPREA